jgi:hypothetical protein
MHPGDIEVDVAEQQPHVEQMEGMQSGSRKGEKNTEAGKMWTPLSYFSTLMLACCLSF